MADVERSIGPAGGVGQAQRAQRRRARRDVVAEEHDILGLDLLAEGHASFGHC